MSLCALNIIGKVLFNSLGSGILLICWYLVVAMLDFIHFSAFIWWHICQMLENI